MQAQQEEGKLHHHGYFAAELHAAARVEGSAMPSAYVGRCMSQNVPASAYRKCVAVEDGFESADSAAGGYASAASNASSEPVASSASAAAAARAAQLDARAEAEAKRQVSRLPPSSILRLLLSPVLLCSCGSVAAGGCRLHKCLPQESTNVSSPSMASTQAQVVCTSRREVCKQPCSVATARQSWRLVPTSRGAASAQDAVGMAAPWPHQIKYVFVQAAAAELEAAGHAVSRAQRRAAAAEEEAAATQQPQNTDASEFAVSRAPDGSGSNTPVGCLAQLRQALQTPWVLVPAASSLSAN